MSTMSHPIQKECEHGVWPGVACGTCQRDWRIEELEALIGQPSEGSHPDEWRPHAETWHAERECWRQEVERLSRNNDALVDTIATLRWKLGRNDPRTVCVSIPDPNNPNHFFVVSGLPEGLEAFKRS